MQDERIGHMLEKELRANPKAATADLQEQATKIKKSVADMGLRSFHGTYVGAVKRRISGRKGGRKKSTGKKSGPRARAGARATAGLRGRINSMIEREIQDAHQSFDGALDKALRRARKLDRIEEFEKIHEVLAKATKMF
jgi:hypothetical protein